MWGADDIYIDDGKFCGREGPLDRNYWGQQYASTVAWCSMRLKVEIGRYSAETFNWDVLVDVHMPLR